MTPQNFTVEDAGRLLGLADQFLEDWESDEGTDDPECKERRSEWDAIRPVFANAPRLLAILQDALLQSGYGITAPIPEQDRYMVPAWIYSAREIIATIRGRQ
jgi:hypothetical protein